MSQGVQILTIWWSVLKIILSKKLDKIIYVHILIGSRA